MSNVDKGTLITQVATEAERQRFERFIQSLDNDSEPLNLERDSLGQYVAVVIRLMWFGWRMKIVDSNQTTGYEA